MNKQVVRKNGNINIIRRSIWVWQVRQGVGRAHSRAGKVDEMKIKILEKHHPTGLTTREFLGLAEISQVLVISE